MTNETLLLRLRTESLSADLNRLKSHLKSVPDRRRDLSDLIAVLGTVADQISKARGAVLGLDTGFSDEIPEKIDDHLKLARKNISTAVKAVEQMQAKCFRVDESPIGGEFATNLGDRTAAALEVLGKVETLPKDSASSKSTWAALLEATRTQTDPIFAEYVEFLGGVALRDTGFDEGISKVADELWRSYTPGGGQSNFLTIPTRQLALHQTFARIIRVTFPDWTIWALPATALEFWRAVASQSVKSTLQATLNNLKEEDRLKINKEFEDHLGDAYATYTMGPAYAFFAITLMLNPAQEEHQNRTRAILSMLECMDGKESDMNPPYKDVRRQLLKAWNAARQQMNMAPLALNLDENQSADDSDPDGVGVRTLVNAFWKTLCSVTSAGFVVDVWNEIQNWIPKLSAGEVDQIPIATGAEMRHVLNAAWLARVSPDRDMAVDLTKAVQQLRDKVLQKGR